MGWHGKEKEGRGPRFVQKKKLHRTRLSSGQWVLPKNYNNLNQIKANFIIKKIGLRNTNMIRADIMLTMDITLIKRAAKVTVTLIPKSRRKRKKI